MIAVAGIAQTVQNGSLLLALPLALVAGAVSFLSPCVLPLVPGYLSFITGMSGAQLARREQARRAPRRRILLATGLFVLGFAAVFVSFGALFGGVGHALESHQGTIRRVLGAVTIVLGLMFAGALAAVPALSREWRWHRLPAAGLAGAPLLGVMFGLGWTPCIGPTLAAVLGLAASTQGTTAARGALLSLVYCLGLGVPFCIVGVAFESSMGALAPIRRHYRAVMVIGGTLLVAVGVLELTGLWAQLVDSLQSHVTGTTLL